MLGRSGPPIAATGPFNPVSAAWGAGDADAPSARGGGGGVGLDGGGLGGGGGGGGLDGGNDDTPLLSPLRGVSVLMVLRVFGVI